MNKIPKLAAYDAAAFLKLLHKPVHVQRQTPFHLLRMFFDEYIDQKTAKYIKFQTTNKPLRSVAVIHQKP